MKIKVDEQDILMLEKNLHAYLFSKSSCRLFVIADYKIEDGEEVIVKKAWWSKKSESTTVKQKFLTAISVQSYHSLGEFVGVLTDEAANQFIHNDLYQLRKNWLELKKMLLCFGLDVVKIEENKS
jgi:hypothetical protein